MSVKIRTRQSGINQVQAGQNVMVIEPSNLYGCQLGDDVFVGPFVEIQKNVSIGARSKIQSHSFICEYVTIGEDCFIGHGVMFANDLFKNGAPNADPASWGRTRIGNRVVIGSGATILAVDICDDAVIGAGAVVCKNISRKGIYAGNPAKLLRELA
ncbi:UDP-3-O-(3-hydroxymyristoyl)glucosamine N-acyltransferase [Serratia oryzae]|uniref:UDP-3-O-(3-hydroxymyristoyl)glucosamine N-acyltransferase n=2 Tax=Serratia oryzae TaxID=2034155 RepID=A0A1S8CPN8_9GAMM|nr:acyltransferase [Serratia oryzae]OMQ25669.1 UDP-3-O-(3-hydroxymyristoyl)glucosamine N-acyltransferase [Serratia oryzae]